MQKEQKEDNNKTIYPTPVFEEVLSRLDSHNVAGGPPVTPGENRSSVGKDTVKRNRSNNDWENRDNGKPWKSRIALRLKFPDVILPKGRITLPVSPPQVLWGLGWLTECQRQLTLGKGRKHKWLFTDGPVWSALPTKDYQPSLPIGRTNVRVCYPLLMYLFIDRCTPTCPLAFPLYFLPLFLGISYSKRVSRQGPVWTPFTRELAVVLTPAAGASASSSSDSRSTK